MAMKSFPKFVCVDDFSFFRKFLFDFHKPLVKVYVFFDKIHGYCLIEMSDNTVSRSRELTGDCADCRPEDEEDNDDGDDGNGRESHFITPLKF